jgi:hypothetical protein
VPPLGIIESLDVIEYVGFGLGSRPCKEALESFFPEHRNKSRRKSEKYI